VDLLIKLLVQILVPLLVGKALREFVPPVYNFSKKYKVSTTWCRVTSAGAVCDYGSRAWVHSAEAWVPRQLSLGINKCHNGRRRHLHAAPLHCCYTCLCYANTPVQQVVSETGKLLGLDTCCTLPPSPALQVPLYLFNNFQIIMIVWQTLSYSRHKLLEQEPYDILLAIMGAIGQVRASTDPACDDGGAVLLKENRSMREA
jgi:hypothetical protein